MENTLPTRSLVSQADSDEHLIRMWLHGRSANTIEAYQRDIFQFLNLCEKPLRQITLNDFQDYIDSLQAFASSTRARKISAVKSLFAFGHRLGYLTFDVGAPVKVPAVKDNLAERILSQEEVMSMLETIEDARNYCIIYLLYTSGMRVSELSRLTWRDFKKRGNQSQITIFGKGGKTRIVLLGIKITNRILSLNQAPAPDLPIFISKKGNHLHRSQIYRIVRSTAERAGLWQKVSPHWMRHAHASHALDEGAPIHLVQATLGHASVATTGRYTHAKPEESSGNYLKI